MANMATRIASAGVLDDLFLWGMTDPAPALQDLSLEPFADPRLSVGSWAHVPKDFLKALALPSAAELDRSFQERLGTWHIALDVGEEMFVQVQADEELAGRERLTPDATLRCGGEDETGLWTAASRADGIVLRSILLSSK